MTRAEAFEALGIPEGSDWSHVQSAYRRRSALGAGESASRVDEAFFVLRRELTRSAWTPGPPVFVTASRRPARRGPVRALAATLAVAAGVLAWRTLRPEAALLPKAAPTAPAPAVLDSPVPAALETPPAGAVNYKVAFDRETSVTTPAGDAVLARVADTMHYYPLDDLNLVGYASRGEPQAAVLALARAEKAAALLVQQHGMRPERIHVTSKVVDFPAPKVELYIIEGF